MKKKVIEKQKKPNPVDVYVGKRIKEIRKSKGMRQGELGKAIGVRFQQIQKYEDALNRVAASRLYMICEALDVTVTELFPKIKKKKRKQVRRRSSTKRSKKYKKTKK